MRAVAVAAGTRPLYKMDSLDDGACRGRRGQCHPIGARMSSDLVAIMKTEALFIACANKAVKSFATLIRTVLPLRCLAAVQRQR